jgi:transporter family-2 protein
MNYLRYALWAALSGAFIPVMGVLNTRLGRSLGDPVHASVVLFAVALVASVATSLAMTRGLPSPAGLMTAPLITLFGGLIVVFYVVSITFLIPRFGVANSIMFVVVAQIVTSAAIDQFGLFGAAVRPVGWLKAGGLVLLIAGLTITQLASDRSR